jgi:hypothetical protein
MEVEEEDHLAVKVVPVKKYLSKYIMSTQFIEESKVQSFFIFIYIYVVN